LAGEQGKQTIHWNASYCNTAAGSPPARKPPAPSPESCDRPFRVDQHQHPAKGVMQVDANRQLEETLEPCLFASSVEGDVLETFGLAQRRHWRR
jgi:hypothetical protein